MAERVERLQGTDGVRGIVTTVPEESLKKNSIAAFTERGLLSPGFTRLYCRAFVRFLRRHLKCTFPRVAVACDPRDIEETITGSAINALQEAGAEVHDLGVLPTPAVPLFVVHEKCDGGLMITASHNPADQNGIKLFLPGLGGKLFPLEDELLTSLVYEEVDADAGIADGSLISAADKANRLFVDTMRQERNSWLTEKFNSNKLALIVDAANGACQTVLRDILEPIDLRYTEYLGMNDDGSVNDNCGAGLYEGVSRINGEYIAEGGRDFRSVDLIQALFRHGREQAQLIREGEFRLVGAAFDGDGDRFYALEYDPFNDQVLILTGDEIAIHQASFLKYNPELNLESVATTATTIESDIAVSSAFEELGFIPVLSGVGDKWLLWEAHCNLFSNACDILEAELDAILDAEAVEQLRFRLEEMEQPSSLQMLELWSELRKLAAKQDINLEEKLAGLNSHSFLLGSEETGHSVTAAFLEGRLPVYSGNGIKSCLNYLAATAELAGKKGGQAFYASLHRPFEPGVKSTLPVYYTEKSRMLPAALERGTIETLLVENLRAVLPEEYHAVVMPRDEEPGLIFVGIFRQDENGEDSIAATVFCRNSGTEAKTSLYVRALAGVSEILVEAVENMYPAVSRILRDQGNPFARAQAAVLDLLLEKGKAKAAELPLDAEEIDPRRLLVEMALKQNLIRHDEDSLSLTERGRRVAEAEKG